MEKKIAGLLGAAALGTLSAAQAAPAPTDVLQANSYADLLQPIPNAAATLRAVNEQAPPQSADANVQLAQFYYHHHHHHHHHGFWHHHHHGYWHHHHHHYGPRVIVVPPRRYYHHHHHHHHHGYWDR